MHWITTHKEELLIIWGAVATLLLIISEHLGLSKKYESNAIVQALLKLIKKSADPRLEKKDEAPPAA
jgi:hypothetical protein